MNKTKVQPGFDADKMTRWIVGIVGFFLIIAGIYQIRSTLFIQDKVGKQYQARLAQTTQDYGNTQFSGDQDAADLVAQTQADPDEDSLSTFDELNIYGTSPYLTDSDSDGLPDNDEIAQNTNPNCPEGQDCAVARTGGDGTTTAAESAFADLDLSQTAIDATATDPATLRQALLEAGVPEATLNDLADDELVSLYNQALNPTTAAEESPQTVDDLINQYRNLSIAEKRQLLIESGAAQTDVDALSDTQVDAILEDSLNQTVEELQSQNTATATQASE